MSNSTLKKTKAKLKPGGLRWYPLCTLHGFPSLSLHTSIGVRYRYCYPICCKCPLWRILHFIYVFERTLTPSVQNQERLPFWALWYHHISHFRISLVFRRILGLWKSWIHQLAELISGIYSGLGPSLGYGKAP